MKVIDYLKQTNRPPVKIFDSKGAEIKWNPMTGWKDPHWQKEVTRWERKLFKVESYAIKEEHGELISQKQTKRQRFIVLYID